MRITAVSDGEDSSATHVLEGIAKHSRHEWVIEQFTPTKLDADIIYVHSGILLSEYSPELISKFNDNPNLNWVAGLRGELNYKRWAVDWNPTTKLRPFTKQLKAVSCANRHYQREMTRLGLNAYYCPSGADSTIFTPKPLPEVFTIGFVGNVEHGEKNYDLFKRLPFKQLVADTSISYSGMPDFYNNISVLICCSFTEGSPIPPKEAALCGRPTVSFNVGDNPEWLPSNLIVGDVEEIIVTLKLMENAPAFIRIYGLLCRMKVDPYDFLYVSQIYDVMFEECLRTI